MKILQSRNMPRWYGLSLDASRRGLIISVDRMFASTVLLPEAAPLIRHYHARLQSAGNFENYAGELKETFGYNKSMVQVGETEQTLEYLLPFVQMRFREPCKACGQTVLISEVEQCPACRGKTYSVEWDSNRGSASAFTLNLFLSSAYWYDKEVLSKKPQLLTLQTVTGSDHGLGGMFGGEMIEFFQQASDESTLHVVAAMRYADHCMGEGSEYDKYGFRHMVRNGGIHLHCPGNACEVDSDTGLKGPNARTFSCHNVDSMLQQFTLIAGLAKLCDLWEEWNQNK